MKSLTVRALFIIVIIALRIILDDYYMMFAAYFKYAAFDMDFKGTAHWMVSYIGIIIVGLLVPLLSNKPSAVFIMFLYLMSYLPTSVLLCYHPIASIPPFAGVSLVMILLSISSNIAVFKHYRLHFSLSSKLYVFLLSLFGIGLLGIVVAHYGLQFKTLSLNDVYEVRESYTENANRLSQYAYGWLSKAVLLVLTLMTIVNRNWIGLVACLLVEYLLFTYGGHKSVLFVLPLAMCFYFGVVWFNKNLPIALSFIFLLLICVLRLNDILIEQGFSFASSLFVRRMLFVPAHLFYAYTDFFSANPVDWFARNFPFNYFLDSQYNNHIPLIIGDIYVIKESGVYANAGIFADAFANAGYFGFILLSIILFIMMRTIDAVSMFKDKRVVIPVFTVFVINLTNSGIIVSLITHGFLLLVIIVAFMSRDRLLLLRKTYHTE